MGTDCSLDGTWKVTSSGIAICSNLLGDVKHIAHDEGYNQLANGKEWGWFVVISTRSPKRFILNYNDSRNPSMLRKVEDIVTVDEKRGGWEGKFYLSDMYLFKFRLDAQRSK